MPDGAVYRQKDIQDEYAITVLNRNMQGLKVDLVGEIPKKGADWSIEIGKVKNARNNTLHDADHSPPAQNESKNGGDNLQMYRVI